ncbi:hypothetical protein J437_LFUL006430 [Ladona fulva]|uniref:Single domain-containing protein n=1 Tax=Ladona fulva TaxID=123851 RepID=A0A8K0NUC2_LADFU|nr:hypothetical protein J437_LFUL006430 [Ladona fulva]
MAEWTVVRMKVLFVFGIILVYISCHSEAYVGLAIVLEDPEHPGQCLSAAFPETRETYHDIGSTWITNSCESHSCGRKDERTLIISITGCTPSPDIPGCIQVPMNSSKPYPHCCASTVCPQV